MDNLLLKYMNERIMHATRKLAEPGPVITISRECGCSGSQLAEKLTQRINEKINNPEINWRWINKEILKLASDELNIHQDEVKKIADSVDPNFLDEIAHSFTDKYYVTNIKAKKMIEEVIRGIAITGRAIIVGRGSEVLSHGIPRSLHLRLFAPLEWKIEIIMERSKISHVEAKKIVLQIDKQRANFRDAYLERNQPPFSYDVEFNCSRLNQDEIIDLTLTLAERRSILI
jgi:Cytidylate kinase-like family